MHLQYSQLVMLRGSGFAVQCGSCKCTGSPETLHQTNKSYEIAMKISTFITLCPSCNMAKGYPGLSSLDPEMKPGRVVSMILPESSLESFGPLCLFPFFSHQVAQKQQQKEA